MEDLKQIIELAKRRETTVLKPSYATKHCVNMFIFLFTNKLLL